MARTLSWRNVAYGVFGVAWVMIAFSLSDRHEANDGAYSFGYFLGMLAASLLIALLVRLAYVKAVAPTRPLWSPWVFVMAWFVAWMSATGSSGA